MDAQSPADSFIGKPPTGEYFVTTQPPDNPFIRQLSVSQLSVFFNDEPGQFNRVLKILADAEANVIGHLHSVSGKCRDIGVARFIIKDCEGAKFLLENNCFLSCIGKVIICKIPDKVGGFYKLLQIVPEDDMEYSYPLPSHYKGHVAMVFSPKNFDNATNALNKAGMSILTSEDIFGALG